jgi:hypothetical protein
MLHKELPEDIKHAIQWLLFVAVTLTLTLIVTDTSFDIIYCMSSWIFDALIREKYLVSFVAKMMVMPVMIHFLVV